MKADIGISHSIIAVFRASLDQPFNAWTTANEKQGFSWRPGSVTFATINDGVVYSVEYNVKAKFDKIKSESIRVIDVPFEATVDCQVLIGSIFPEITLELTANMYALRIELSPSGSPDYDGEARLTFAWDEKAKFDIVVADDQLDLSEGLVTTSKPA